jgi:chromate transport protein ChrA
MRAVIAIILQALWSLARTAIKSKLLAVLAVLIRTQCPPK